MAMESQTTCRSCGTENPAGARFCMSCGSSLARSCPTCGAEVPAGARFCMSCGNALDEVAAPAAGETPTPHDASGPREEAAPSEERRTVTVLFADLSGYTAVAERLDHETVKALTDRCLTRLAGEVQRFGGHVDKYIGDNVMAVFGAPVAHEDDPERAVRAAFGMQAAMAELNQGIEPEFGFALPLRIGVNTGEVLAGHVGDAYTVVGDAVNVAARLQAAAPIGGILVGERTFRSTQATVQYRELEPLTLKGKAEPVSAWGAEELREPGRPHERGQTGTPLVGREAELSQLETLYERVARDGAPHLVTLVGQAGVGKTRVLHELEGQLARDERAPRVLRGRCLAFGSSVVYWPLTEMLRGECAILDGDTSAEVDAKLSERLGDLLAAREGAEQAERRLAPLARLLGGDVAGEEPGGEVDDGQSAREAFFGAVRSVLEALAHEQPLLLAWEDIHWADEGTLDLIEYLSQWLRAPALQVALARDELLERRPSWSTLRRVATTTFLEPLAPDEIRQLIAGLMHKAGAEGELPEALAERSGGNPLFAEAMVQRIAEEGGATAAELPETVQGLLAARLDSLERFERQLVSHAAVLGRTFWESALEPVAAAAGADLAATLASLREKDIIVPGEAGQLADERELAFKHVLIRDVAYETLPKAVRAHKHAEVGAFIEERAGDRSEGVVGLLAEHYGLAATLAAEVRLQADELAQLRAKALAFSEAAGDGAGALFANREALMHYESAEAFADGDDPALLRIAEKRGDIELRLGRVEPAIDAWQRCLAHFDDEQDLEHVAELHRKIGAALAHKGERKQAIEHHQQGINLIKDMPPSLALVRLYEEAAWLYMQVGDNMLAIYASEKALRLAETLGEARAASRAHGIFGRVFGRIGDTAKARENLERAVALARDSDAGETVLALLALGHSLEHSEGDYEAAEACYREALALAERIGDVPAQIELQSALAQLAVYRCDWEQARRAGDAGAELAEREGLIGKLCLSNTLRGLLAWRDGDLETSTRLFATGHELAEQVGWSEVSLSALLGLAVTQRDGGDLPAAEETLARALAVCERAGLIPQSIRVHASTTLVCALAGREAQARDAAERAEELASRVHDPVGKASALEARGIAGDHAGAVEALIEARALWEQLGRPLDVARCDLLLGRRQLEHDPAAASETLARAAAAYEELGVGHLAERSRELVTA
jgi:class 3 adenylate cyclase/tetratricopeptide (TPR) repeat protein